MAGDIILDNTNPYNMHIIQGEDDKYTTKSLMEETIKNSKNFQIQIDYIKDADHSYRDSYKNPIYEDTAVGLIKF